MSGKPSTFLAWIVRMSLIKRWALMHSFRRENVSEHSHQTAVIAHLLCVIRNRLFAGQTDPQKAATLAIYHEISETKLQDLNSKTKYMNPEFTRQYKALEKIAENECLQTLPSELQEDFRNILIQDNVDPEYKAIVKAADLLAAYIKVNDELRFHNLEFAGARDSLLPRIEELYGRMPEVRYFMDTFIASCWASVDELTGIDQRHAGQE